MKKVLILALALAAAALCGCDKSNSGAIVYEELNPATLSLNPESIDIAMEENSSASAAVTTDSDALSVIVDAPYRSWLGASISGNSVVAKALTRNPKAAAREGVIIVSAGRGINTTSLRVTVRQALNDAIPALLELSTDKATIGSSLGAEAVITVTTDQPSYTAVVEESGRSWCGLSIDGSALKIMATEANQAITTRTTSITVSAGEGKKAVSLMIVVTQKAKGLEIGDVLEGGVVFWIAEDNSYCKVVSPKRGTANESPFSKEKIGTGATDADNGAVNQSLIMARDDYNAENFPAFAFCAGLGKDWYLPASRELQALMAAYNGTAYGAITQTVPSGLTDAEKASRAKFDATLVALGGTELNTQAADANGDSAFSSTENSDANAYYLRFGKVALSNGAKTSTSRPARCIRVVNL